MNDSSKTSALELPAGTVTFLFTDIEGSTRLLDHLAEDYVKLLADHHRILRGIFARWQGTEFGTEGDVFFVSRMAPVVEGDPGRWSPKRRWFLSCMGKENGS